MDGVWIALGCFILIGFTIEAITGFGGTVIALALGALMLPMPVLLPILVPLSLAMGLTLVWRHNDQMERALLVRLVLPAMLVGMALGYGVRTWLDAASMRQLFGILVIWCAAQSLWRPETARASRASWHVTGLTCLAGVTHGLFASGGPLLVYALSGVALDKLRFRMTMIAVWLVLDAALTVAFVLDGRLEGAVLHIVGYLPVVAVGVWFGERMHRRVSERHFQRLTAILLLVTGGLLVMPR